MPLSFAMSDVRNRGALTDYTGGLDVRTAIRTTDRLSGSPTVFPATLSDWTLRFTVPCASTPDPNIGGDCSLNTSAETLIPGAVSEGKRPIWELGQGEVFDGGDDGLV